VRNQLRSQKDAQPEITLGFYCRAGFSLDGLSMSLEFFEAANMHAINSSFVCKLISCTGGEVVSSCGISVETISYTCAEKVFDYLFVLSGPNRPSRDQDKLPSVVRNHIVRGSTVCSLNGGVFALADTGVLGNGPCAVSVTQQAAFSELYPEIEVSYAKFNINNSIWTVSKGPLCFILLNNLFSRHESRVVCSMLSDQAGFVQDPECNCRSDRNIGDGRTSGSRAVDQAIQLFRENIEETILVSDVARHTGFSLRHLERKFINTLM